MAPSLPTDNTHPQSLYADISDIDIYLDPKLASTRWLESVIGEQCVDSGLALIRRLNSELDEIDARLDAAELAVIDYSYFDIASVRWLSSGKECFLLLSHPLAPVDAQRVTDAIVYPLSFLLTG